MDDREYRWHLKRIGKITASEVSKIMTASGRWTQTAVSYLYKIQRQRTIKEPAPIKNAKTLKWGRENEIAAIEWLRENLLRGEYKKHTIFHCDSDGDEKVFIEGENNFGGSPDAYLMKGGNIVAYIEIKCVYGEEETNWLFSPTVPMERKRERVMDEHLWQLAGQMSLPGAPDTIMLVKYDAQDIFNDFDVRVPEDPSRGLIFTFTREELTPHIEVMKERVAFANKCLEEGVDLDVVQTYWEDYKDDSKRRTDRKRRKDSQ